MSRNFALAAVVATTLLIGTKTMADDPAPPPAPAAAAAPDTKPADKLSRVLGGISAIDATAKTITLKGYDAPDQTIAFNDDTTYMLDVPADAADIKVGDTLRAISLSPAADPASITPNYLNIVPPVDLNGPPFTWPTPVEGVVATLKPLTITTPDNKTVTITIGHDTLLSKSIDATMTDVKVGKFGSGIVKGEGSATILTQLHIITPPTQ